MIGSRQIMPKMPTGGGHDPELYALFVQGHRPMFADAYMTNFVIFGGGTLAKCYAFCQVGTFTAEVYIDGLKTFAVSHLNGTVPAYPVSGSTGELDPAISIVEVKILGASSLVSGIFIRAQES